MKIDPYKSGVSIVLAGAFNPVIFSPLWFKNHNLITESELESANVELQHRELTIFRLDWMDVQVQLDRFKIATEQSPYIRLSDFVVKTFREFLSHTPISMIGINRMVQFTVDSEEIRNKIGNKLAPPDVWGDWGKQVVAKDDRGHGGMTHLVMEQRAVDDRDHGYVRADIRPSSTKNNGIFMEINDHYEVHDENLTGNDKIIDLLESSFEKSIARSESIINHIMEMKDEFRK